MTKKPSYRIKVSPISTVQSATHTMAASSPKSDAKQPVTPTSNKRRSSFMSLFRTNSRSKKAAPPPPTVDSMLTSAEDQVASTMEDFGSFLQEEMIAAETVDKIQAEVKVERERRYTLERRASEARLEEAAKRAKAAQEAAEQRKAEAQQRTLMKVALVPVAAAITYAVYYMM